MNDPTQFEQVDETCEFGGAVLYSESLGITAFFENAVPSKYETQKLKQLQFGIENEKIRQFEHECLIRLFQWSFLPPGKALDFSVCDEAFGCYKTQYRKRYLLEICQNASFLSTPDTEKACDRNGDRLSSYSFSMRVSLYSLWEAGLRLFGWESFSKKQSGEGHSPDCFLHYLF